MTKELYADIIVNISADNLDRPYQYRIPHEYDERIRPGMAVMIPFGKSNRLIKGYVIAVSEVPKFEVSRIKDIASICKKGVEASERLLELAVFMKQKYGCTMNEAIKTVMPVKNKVKDIKIRTIKLLPDKNDAISLLAAYRAKANAKARVRLLEALIDSDNNELDASYASKELKISAATLNSLQNDGIIRIDEELSYRRPEISSIEAKAVMLNECQQKAADEIIHDYESGIRREYLIHGITGSGKTEVYMAVMDRVISMGKQVIVLIPEIALTYQTAGRFFARYGDRVSVLNSRMSQGERYDQYVRAKAGELDVIIGPRSALFAPFENLGLIVIDEEHESGYKSESIPRYHAAEVAGQLARLSDASVIYGSATPSVTTFYRTRESYKGDRPVKLLTLDKRTGTSTLPDIHLVDMREEFKRRNYGIISNELRAAIEDRLRKKEQTVLFINRRGYSSFVSCRNCGEPVKCPHCDVSLTVHNNGRMLCHYCGYGTETIKLCPNCGSSYIGAFGTGTQKVEEMVSKMFKDARVLRMDADTTGKKNGYADILSAFANHEADILIGTQMIIKGHDFSLVTLVGVLAADMSLNISDYTAAERSFQILVQAAGRAGRGEKKGDVYIQTYQPEHYAVTTSKAQDYQAFYEKEMYYRKMLSYPPAAGVLSIMLSSEDENLALRIAKDIAANTKLYFKNKEKAKILGPAPHFIAKKCDCYRYMLYVKYDDKQELYKLRDIIKSYVEVIYEKEEYSIMTDVD